MPSGQRGIHTKHFRVSVFIVTVSNRTFSGQFRHFVQSIFHSAFCVCRPSAIRHQEYVIPSSCHGSDTSPTTVVIKTNPLYRTTSPPRPDTNTTTSLANSGAREGEVSRPHEGFYGQRRKIRKTKEHEMISAVMDITKHSELSKTVTGGIAKNWSLYIS